MSRDPERSLVLDRYVLHGAIASGGMATVNFGRAVGAAGFSRPVAIKRLHPHLAGDPEFATMFLDEGRLAARVRHKNVVATLDVVAAGDELCLVMEYVHGESLAALLEAARRAGKHAPPAIAASIVAGALEGLHAAHEARAEDGRPLEIVHRDVSPQNVLVGEDGIARVLDFGVARAAVRSRATRDGKMRGKLGYMAPEQLRGAPATRRTDVYAASVVLWEALTGERLFDGDTDGAVYGKILEGVVRPPSAITPGTAALDDVVMRGLARDADARYATAHELAVAIEAALQPASAREVAAWVRAVAGPVLAERARRVEAMEIRAARSAGRMSDAHAPPTEISTPAMHDATRQPSQPALAGEAIATSTLTVPVVVAKSARLRRGAIAAASLTLVIAIALGARFVRTPSAAPLRLGVGRAALLASLRAPAVAPPPAATATATASATASAAAEPPAEPALPKRAFPAAASRGRLACDPPYFVDPRGIRRVKRECLR